jgi:hypothetical protein
MHAHAELASRYVRVITTHDADWFKRTHGPVISVSQLRIMHVHATRTHTRKLSNVAISCKRYEEQKTLCVPAVLGLKHTHTCLNN